MKRAIAFVTALVIAAGAVAPAASVFAADLPAVPVNSDNLSIWDISTSTPDNPYNTTDVFNIVNDIWGDLYDDGRFNNTTVSDFQRYLVEWSITKYIEAAPDEEVNGVTVSYFDDIVDYICANPADFDIYWYPDALSLAFFGDPYGKLQLGDDFFDNLKEYVLANYYSSGSLNSFVLGGYTFYLVPSGGSISGTWFNTIRNTSSYDEYFCFPSGISSSPVWVGSFYSGCTIAYSGSGANINSFYNGSVSSGYCIGLNMSGAIRDSISAAFFGNNLPSSDPVSNGKVYIRDEPIGGDTLTFSYPAYPVSNSKAVSNYYYNTYGDTWEDNSTVIDDTVYNNNLTTLYPVTYDNNIPLWLIQSNSTIETFDYSLELPSAPLETLPADFEGGGSFFQNSFVVLGGFGAFVLVGLSFSLVGLFFKE